MPNFDLHQLAADIKLWGRELGFQQIGITDIELGEAETRLQEWLAKGYHGSMEWLAAHGNKRSRPAELLPGTVRVISVRMDYLPGDTQQIKILKDPTKASANQSSPPSQSPERKNPTNQLLANQASTSSSKNTKKASKMYQFKNIKN